MVLYGKIDITDTSSTKRTLGGENRGYSFTRPRGKAQQLVIEVADPNKTFQSQYEAGSIVELYSDTNSTPTTKVFRGIVEYMDPAETGLSNRPLRLICTEYFYERLMNTTVAKQFHNLDAGQIAKELFSEYLPAFNTDNITASTVTITVVTFDHVPFVDALNWLARQADLDYYCTAALAVYMFIRKTRDTGLSYTTSNIASDPPPRAPRFLPPVKNLIIVRGGFTIDNDQSQTDPEVTFKNSNGAWYAVKFSPTKFRMKSIELYLKKIGSPTADFPIAIKEDISGVPTGDTIIEGSISAVEVSTSVGWEPARMEADLQTDRDYWIVTKPVGDGSNYYAMATEGTGTAAVKESSDGATWSSPGSSYSLSFKETHGRPIVATAKNPASIALYDKREVAVIDNKLQDQTEAKRIALTMLQKLGTTQLSLSDMKVLNQTSIPQPGELITVTVDQLTLSSEKMLLQNVTVKYPPGHASIDDASFTINAGDEQPDPQRLLAEVIRELREARITGNPPVVVDTAESFNEIMTLTDTLDSAITSTGTFVVGTATVGFSDAA